MCKEGVTAKEVYNTAFEAIRARGLDGNFVKNIGFASGLEYRDSSFLLAPKNERKLKANMILIVTLGLQNLSDKKGS